MSEPPAPVDLVLLWHHHQPDYRRPGDRRAVLPWALLHASKDYLDMARHLDRHRGVRVTFNLVPALVDQLEAAAAGEPDAFLELLARPLASLGEEERRAIAWRCVHIAARVCERWPAARAARDLGAALRDRPGRRASSGTPVLSDADLLALEIWFLLAWVDPMFHGEPEAARALAEHPRWSERHRDDLLALQRRLTREVLPAYRALAARGQVELSTSPYHHPILPLLIDLGCARRAQPGLPLPAESLAAPEDARWHIEQALARHAAVFGARPAGLWPSEGSLSPEAVGLAAQAGVRWMASDEGVLWASLAEGERIRGAHYRPWACAGEGGQVTLFFRDRELSDRIGFVYQRWEAREAAADFVARLRRIGREHAGEAPPVVSVILDGENCWEHYRDDGNRFLDALYGALAEAGDIRTRTPSQVIAESPSARLLPRLHSGSWIDADFHVWVGHPEKNRAWEQVARARRALLAAGATAERVPAAWRALYRAQGSDWFWWFGDDHHTPDKPIFDQLFRELVGASYQEAGLSPAPSLRLPIVRVTSRAGTPEGPIGFVHPTLDGRRTTFYEWHAAGRFVPRAGAAMHRARDLVRALHYGFDPEHFYLRLDLAAGRPPGVEVDLVLDFVDPRAMRVRVRGLAAGQRSVTWEGGEEDGTPVPGAACGVGPLIEIGIPFASLGLAAGEEVALLIEAWRGGRPIESYPSEEGFGFTVPGPDFEACMWCA